MISRNMIDFIEQSGEELAKRLVEDLLTREETKHLRNLRQTRIYGQIYDVYGMLSSWLGGGKTKGKIVEHYVETGREKYNEGIPLSEVIMMLMLIKRHLWLFLIEKKFFAEYQGAEKVLEVNNRVVFFFDRIIWCVSVGYEREQKEDDNKV
ncbi:MAG: hypothetical protein M0Q23_05815 [Syntrophales bacterium]|nr:hypothetical protein [Syntrophales bacterium]MCK9528151.1 hypothetical protein [Syntrophales bacterium]MDX9921121.1 hypothetical protein [Syntrophales bacterium]